MSSPPPSTSITPGRSLGFMTLGASLHDILTRVKAQPSLYPKIQILFDPKYPLRIPVVITLPENGVRLRFDGPDQRLRIIEVIDFTKTRLSYKNTEVVKAGEGAVGGLGAQAGPTGPRFRHVYDRLLGPTYAGEYIPPAADDTKGVGTYVLSYPGIAFNFPLQASSWSADKDFVSLLSSHAASAATSMAIFHGESWSKARGTLFSHTPPNPRSLELAAKANVADEVEVARIYGEGRIELVRRSSPPFWIDLSETTPQDLITELGPPDAIYRKNDNRLSIHGNKQGTLDALSNSVGSMGYGDAESSDTDDHESFTGSDPEESEESEEGGKTFLDSDESASTEHFYNYFHHGFDVLISRPTSISTPSPTSPHELRELPKNFPASRNSLVATKVIFHGNVPGSYPFNRHRRSRWTLEHVPTELYRESLTSEMAFKDVKGRLCEAFKSACATEEEERSMQRGMVLNRGWGDSPGSSCELLGGFEETTSSPIQKKKGSPGGASAAPAVDSTFGISEIFGFPGLIFEVLKNDTVSTLTVI
ncbi:hypothetical protein GTA08_BOTSDO04713 [Botryosphaeria dothidea]|uniref:Uncharacterized protein n=1 Tax=Botryosphaeria dothidea TaxID=55169 RepID=A0A8H4IXL6_9PEZI|nr:hypothetical protein GTA08_BOTSDO04713 [Botryosphaeria dothidea]